MKIERVLTVAAALYLTACSTTSRIDRELRQTEEEQNFFLGLVVYDTRTNRVLVNHQGNRYFTPASNAKLFTFYTAWRTFREVDSVTAFTYCLAGDSLILRGAADPSFLHPETASRASDFLKKGSYALFLEASDMEEEPYGPGWAWEDYASGFMPERAVFPVYGNRVRIEYRQDSLRVHPAFFSDRVSLVDHYRAPRDRGQNHFYVKRGSGSWEKEIPFLTSDQLTADLLSDAVGRKVTLIPPREACKYDAVKSVPYDSLYTRMLVNSDNFVAEQLLLQVGREVSGSYSASKAIDFALKNYMPDIPQQPKWVDGSGLSRYNLFTPESMVYLLRRMYQEIPREQLFAYLPAGGRSGTLDSEFGRNIPFVIAKTGTLANNYSLSGFLLTRKGNVLLFSYMNNHYAGPSSQRKKEMQDIFRRLYEKY